MYIIYKSKSSLFFFFVIVQIEMCSESNIPTSPEVPRFTYAGDQHESSSQPGLQGTVRAGTEASEVHIH